MPFKPVDNTMNFVKSEGEILKYWKDNDIFAKTLKATEDKPEFVFYEGPPTANGRPHPGHILTRVIKDVFPRYKTMCGYHVPRKGGWDTHGLPVEIEVEKELGLDGKEQIIEYGIEKFIKKCRESVFKYKDEWVKTTERMGFWLDLDNAYITLTDEYIESVWWALKKIHGKGLLYQGHKIVPYCPRCGTALSSHEVAQGYAQVEDPSIFIKFQSLDEPEVKYLVWTTTPWTLISNVALAIAPNEKYVKFRHGDEILVMAKALLSAIEGEKEIISEFSGGELIGKGYKQLMPFIKPQEGEKAFIIVGGDFVSMEDGTGIVHIAPAFGEDDNRIGKEEKLAFFQPVLPNGNFSNEIEPWAGLFVKKADPLIIEWLKGEKKLFKAEKCTHTYPFCWRCNSPLIYYARGSWFIGVTKVKDQLLEANKTIKWLPEHIRDGRFGNFLENLIDWAISRERFWGTPLPIWICDDPSCGHETCIGSRKELEELGQNVPKGLELHKPYVDEIRVRCEKCGGQSTRVPEVIDCWFDSGCMHTAQWHYPFENKDTFDKSYPADFISEAIDQTRGWFYSLLATGVLLHGQSPYKRCIVIGHVLGKDGQKMSKSKGNTTDPWVIFDNQGADAMRWYFYTVSSPWSPRAFYEEAIREVQARFLGTLRNVYAFFVLYANIDGWDPKKHEIQGQMPIIDRWLISRFNTLVKEIKESMDDFDATKAARLAEEFLDELSNWYLRRCRRRYWEKGMEKDKRWAYQTLYRVLVDYCRLIAPFVPFIAEDIWLNLVGKAGESVHLQEYPIAQENMIDKQLEEAMSLAKEIVVMGRSARNSAKIKNRQPLKTLMISGLNQDKKQLLEPLFRIMLDELNVKSIDFISDDDKIVTLKVKPSFKELGPVYGKDVKSIVAYLISGKISASDINKSMLEKGFYQLLMDGKEFEIKPEMVEIESQAKEGFGAISSGGMTVAITTNIDEELRFEGYARELVNKIQTMRKEADFEISDRITLYYSGDENISETFARFGEEIAKEVLANEIICGISQIEKAKKWKINDLDILLFVEK